LFLHFSRWGGGRLLTFLPPPPFFKPLLPGGYKNRVFGGFFPFGFFTHRLVGVCPNMGGGGLFPLGFFLLFSKPPKKGLCCSFVLWGRARGFVVGGRFRARFLKPKKNPHVWPFFFSQGCGGKPWVVVNFSFFSKPKKCAWTRATKNKQNGGFFFFTYLFDKATPRL